MGFYDFPHTRNYDTDLGYLIGEYKKLNSEYKTLNEKYTILVQIYDVVKKNIKDVTIEQLEKWLEDGTLESIIKSLIVTKRRFILIGDSYGNRVNEDSKNYFTLVQEYLNINNNDYFHVNLGGASFYHRDSNYTFLHLLTTLENTVTEPENITDIIVIGGANDALYTYDETYTSIANFYNYVKEHYIKANISLIGLGLTFTNHGMAQRQTMLKAWKDSIKLGINFIKNSEFTMCNSTLLTDDLCHPNANGVNEIAKQIAKSINSGICDVNYELSNIAILNGSLPEHSNVNLIPVNFNAVMRLNNNITTIDPRGGAFMLSFNTNLVPDLAAENEIKLNLDKTLLSNIENINLTHYGLLRGLDNNKCYHVSLMTYVDPSGNYSIRVFLQEPIPASAGNYHFQLLANFTAIN